MKIFIAGTFDNFHVGHQYLCWSDYSSDIEMVIVVARDQTVHRIKGYFSKNQETDRLVRVQQEFDGYPNVNIRLGNENGDFLETLREESPTHLLLGYDQGGDIEKIKKTMPDLVIKRGKPYFSEFFKSSKF